MTDTREELSMEQHARNHADSITADTERLDRMEELATRAAQQGSGLYRMLDESAAEFREELEQRNYGAGVRIVIDVCMYGGGPAGGVEFICSRGDHGLEWDSARVWHQDWFQPKGYADLDENTTNRLWDLWGLEYMMEGM